MFAVKTSPSKKSRTVPGGVARRGTQALVPTQLQLADENRQYLNTEAESDQGETSPSLSFVPSPAEPL